jgi:hypothetical protein
MGLRIHCLLMAIVWSSSAWADAPSSGTDETPRASTLAPSAPFVAAPEPVSQTHWYGWQTLLVDGASLGAFVGGFWLKPANQDWSVVSIVGVGGYAVGAPIVHWSHGRVGVGFASLSFRVGLPALALLLASTPCSTSECSEQSLALGFGLLAIPAAIVLDAAWLARERLPSGVAPSAQSAVSFVPFISALGDRRMLGASGRF